MSLDLFHPLVGSWFKKRFSEPTAPQAAGWPEIVAGRDTLIAAPTGSGKTLAAFLWSINRLVQAGADGTLEDKTCVVYVSPLKALGNDIQKNLQAPLREILRLAAEDGVDFPEINVMVRSGDTPTKERELMVRRSPHILITTPESLYILLTAERSRRMLQTAETVIIDEIHAVAWDKRGAHLALSLERLDVLCGRRLQRIGLSATQKPIEEIARLLVGNGRALPDGRPDCALVNAGSHRQLDLSVEVPGQELGAIATHEVWSEVYDRVASRVENHRTTIVFVNTRRLVERVSHHLETRLGRGRVAAHHGSLSRRTRLEAEQGLKAGEIPAIVATASLELGIDVGHVDLVCHLGAPRALATLLQRVGRAGHWLGAVPKGILFPMTRDELVQCAAAIRAVRRGGLDCVVMPEKPLDILAQQIVASAAAEEIQEEEIRCRVRRAYPYRDLTNVEWEAVLEMLSEGISTKRGRRSAHLHRDRVNGRIKGRRGARLAAITSGGAIPDTADYDVIEDPAETFVGKVNEDFAVESLAGDIFLLGNKSWRIRRVESGKVRVEDAQGAPPSIPFWLGEAPSRTPELSAAVSELREEVAERIQKEGDGRAAEWLKSEAGLDSSGAEQVVAYLRETLHVLGAIPTQRRVVAERFFDESGGMQLVLHAPFGGRVNRAWGLALRKRFCLTFDFELQAAATDDGIVLSLGQQHSFPLESVFGFVRPAPLEADLVQAALQSPMFTNRWRWNATRALAILRRNGGRRVPMALQRMRAEDLLAAVFPDQVACQDNHFGPITPPDHPLVNETLQNCLREAMDIDSLREIVERMEKGEIRTVAVETPAPSAISHEILNANPYALLDDAPLEERRARAVSLRRTLPETDDGVGNLDPEAIAEVRAQAWPDVRDADELHDALLSLVVLPVEEAGPWAPFAEELISAGRAVTAGWSGRGAEERRGYVAVERVRQARAALPGVGFEQRFRELPPTRPQDAEPEQEESLRAIVRGWMESTGPITVERLAERLGLAERAVRGAMEALEGQGLVLQGRFSPDLPKGALGPPGGTVEWCDRLLLARIHRMTLGRLRREIEPVTAADFMRFLLRWQHVHPGTQLHGRDGVVQVISQLQGVELPAPAWERYVLPTRIENYDPQDLESLCLAGVVAWGRIRLDPSVNEETSDGRDRRRPGPPSRQAPLAFLLREDLAEILEAGPLCENNLESLTLVGRDVYWYLESRGASFLADISRETGHLKTAVEEGLWELVSRGLATGDGMAGLRALLMTDTERKTQRRNFQSFRGRRASERFLPAGRWSLWRPTEGNAAPKPARLERLARQLLRRYGVVFREMLGREAHNPPWREVLMIYRRMEARGEICGGRFVNGFIGEQFALPEAVEALRAVRRNREGEETVIVSAADPLNLVGIVTPGARVSPLSHHVIAYRDGTPTEIGTLGEVRSQLLNLAPEESRVGA
ncbi:MAG: DEAD/DEAH box helicase [Nitrospinota bacterium]